MNDTILTKIFNVITSLATKDDRWFFIATLVALLALLALMIRWLRSQLAAVAAQSQAATHAYQSALIKTIRTQNATTRKLAVCIDRNTQALTECNYQLRRIKDARPLLLLLLLPLILLTFSACSTTRPQKPGSSSMRLAPTTNGLPAFVGELRQPENPARPATQTYQRTTESELHLPAGTSVAQFIPVPATPEQPASVRTQTFLLAKPAVQKSRTTESAGTIIGAAQKDTTREIAAKLASLRPIVFLGILLFIAGLASMFWPPLKAIVNSVTTSAAMILGGLALIFLPSLIVGNELLIFGGVALALVSWFIAHRYGRLQGFVDANKNGIDDRLETPNRQS